MNRTLIIEHYKKFHNLETMDESSQIDIDWAEALIEDMQLVKNCNLQNVSNSEATCFRSRNNQQYAQLNNSGLPQTGVGISKT